MKEDADHVCFVRDPVAAQRSLGFFIVLLITDPLVAANPLGAI